MKLGCYIFCDNSIAVSKASTPYLSSAYEISHIIFTILRIDIIAYFTSIKEH